MSDVQSVLVVGDLYLERTIEGTASRLSPEAPAPILDVARIVEAPAGAGNVALNIVAMGGNVRLVAAVGADDAARILGSALTCNGFAHHVTASPDVRTVVRTRITGNGQELLQLVDEESYAGHEEKLLTEFTTALELPDVQLVVIVDRNLGTLSDNTALAVMQAAARKNLDVFVDTVAACADRYRTLATLLKLNWEAARQATAGFVHPALCKPFLATQDATAVVAEFIAMQYGVGSVLITRGPLGCTWLRRGDPPTHWLPQVAVAGDAHGAGEVFMAAFVVGHLEENGDQFNYANLAAGLSLQQPGLGVVSRDQLDEAVYRRDQPQSKIMAGAALDRFLARRRGLTGGVAFMHGSFSVLHPGIADAFTQAVSCGHSLVVGVDSDASLAAMAGAVTPGDELSRALLVASHKAVAAVVIVDRRQPLEAIRQIRPELYCLDESHRDQPAAAVDHVARYGGRIEYLRRLPGYSPQEIASRCHGLG